MGIYLIKKGNIICDKCKKIVAGLIASQEIMENLQKHSLEITCVECTPVPMGVDN